MSTFISNFIDSLCISQTPRRFPTALRQTYAELMEQFKTDPLTKGFNRINAREGFQDSTPRGVAHRVFWWFPTHFFKFQDALLRWEKKCVESDQTCLLERPKVTFVDIGCGTGAASAAVIATLESYQDFCRIQNVRIEPVHIDLIALDSVQAELDTYRKVIADYAYRVGQHKLSINIQTICQRFPEGNPQIIEALSSCRGHALIVGMSNLIKWIWPEWDEQPTGADSRSFEKLNSKESAALRQLATQTHFDACHIIGVATKSKNDQSLFEKLTALFKKIAVMLRFVNRSSTQRQGGHAKVSFENPEGSHWAKNGSRYSVNYFVENLVDIAPDYTQDDKWHQALSMDSLEAAWAKVRNYMQYESLTDGVELKLFEADLDTNLKRLRAACQERANRLLNVEFDLPYQYPKAEDATRPKSLARFEEQIVAVAISLQFAKKLKGECPEVSYSFRLAPFRNEFLYEYWFPCHREYLKDILEPIGNYNVCGTDIKSYYVNIRQSLLFAILRERQNTSARCHELLAATIMRDCHPPHQTGYGLLQGHALSGLLSNVMLQPVDEKLLNQHSMRGRYFRYTDDITITGTNPLTQIIDKVQQELSRLDKALELNHQKTFYCDQQEYKMKAMGGSDKLNHVGKRFGALLRPLYDMSTVYRREFHRSRWEFVHTYQRLLQDVGIYFTPEWLCRKLDKSDSRRWQNFFRRKWKTPKWKIDWPKSLLLSSVKGQLEWKEAFKNQNQGWIDEKCALAQELSAMLKQAAETLLAGGIKPETQTRQRRIVNFALHRLSVFGVDDAVPDVVQLVGSQPWNVRIEIACRALVRIQQEDPLIEILTKSKESYVRAIALKALGHVQTSNSVSVLASILDDEAEPVEKLMASEGLLWANLWQQIHLSQIQTWLEKESQDPYVQKNIILILGQAYPSEARELLSKRKDKYLHPIVRQAVHYTLTKPLGENLLWKAEPDVLRKYRAKSYPIIEESLGNEASYSPVSR